MDIPNVRTYDSGKMIIDIPAGFKELEIVTGSGDAELENISARTLKLSTSSGDVEARNIALEQAEVRTSSGDSEFSGKAVKYFGRSGSGDQKIEIEGKLSEGEFITGSGDIELKIKDNTGAEITASTGSGDVDVRTRLNVESCLNGYVVGDGSAKISVKTGSGDADILL